MNQLARIGLAVAVAGLGCVSPRWDIKAPDGGRGGEADAASMGGGVSPDARGQGASGGNGGPVDVGSAGSGAAGTGGSAGQRDAGGTAPVPPPLVTCDARSCKVNNSCVPSDTTSHCGPSCGACYAPEGAVALCTGGACDYRCTTGARCDGACYPCCGPAECTEAPERQSGACTLHECSYTCRAGYMTCPTTPQCAAFAQGFESGDVDNWAPTLQTAGPFARPAVVTGVAHSGSFALAVSIRNGNGRVVLARPLCTAGALAVIPSTRRISVWVRWEGPAFTANDVGTGCELGLLYQGADLPYGASDRVIRPIGSWQQIVSSIVGDASQADVDCYVNEPWTGTLYFDDFTIE